MRTIIMQRVTTVTPKYCMNQQPALSNGMGSRMLLYQVQEDCPGPLEKWYRHISKGAWPFSSRDHGWPIADCSAEGLKVLL